MYCIIHELKPNNWVVFLSLHCWGGEVRVPQKVHRWILHFANSNINRASCQLHIYFSWPVNLVSTRGTWLRKCKYSLIFYKSLLDNHCSKATICIGWDYHDTPSIMIKSFPIPSKFCVLLKVTCRILCQIKRYVGMTMKPRSSYQRARDADQLEQWFNGASLATMVQWCQPGKTLFNANWCKFSCT